ncbi:DUF4383 domain-containing protein [Rhodococcus antarcticus]|jgi:hypothetical protein|uniref:DUF4383 domain-containing protein n=1 Tax=Rhodococcus antarcticus TaxID=2987751 RepID=A0ABY6P2M0_9NOCA|nr:DUF4383 domain-containing protein [Rhodococcus antarcticus]UZJ25526.1 DUF4383 domain-containing protein [Rhodococcus antarcticus]
MPTDHHRTSPRPVSPRPTSRRHGRLATLHRLAAAVAALVLATFGVLGLVDRLGLLETAGTPVLGLTSNGLLSVVSLVVAAVLLTAAAVGGPTASTVTASVGVAFLVSGLANLALLDTAANLLAFTIPNVLFSLVAGVLLLTAGLYGRASGALPADNPYRRARALRHPGPGTEVGPDMPTGAELDRLSAMEIRVSDGHGTPAEQAQVCEDLRRRAQAAHDRAWELAARR